MVTTICLQDSSSDQCEGKQYLYYPSLPAPLGPQNSSLAKKESFYHFKKQPYSLFRARVKMDADSFGNFD